ncbi:C2 domain [Dillenia turbinata]|uniref:C2 domain n=1 Tax=Dillenia turbinata TaxID=194707 RepID=A0AAN8VAX2_9MAGN
MENIMGLLRIRVKKGANLAVRDTRSSDPFVVVSMGAQMLKTNTVHDNIHPEWNDELTLAIANPDLIILLGVYDKDTFTVDDPMGDAEIDIKPYLESLKGKPQALPDGTVVSKVKPTRENCLAEESSIYWKNGKLIQDMCLRLRNTKGGEVQIQIEWIHVPGSKGL